MTSRFASYATSTAFCVTMSRTQIAALTYYFAEPGRRTLYVPHDQTCLSLIRMGLLTLNDGVFVLTEAATLLYPLLQHCNLTAEHTIAASGETTPSEIRKELNSD